MTSRETPPKDDSKRRLILESAIGVFARFGYRKTSMDEVARAARISRQGLYLHFETKEDLFRAVVVFALDGALERATAGLANEGAPLETRLVDAFDAWMGPYVGAMQGGAADIFDASKELLGETVFEYEARFSDLVAKHLKTSGLVTPYKPAGVTAKNLADSLGATSCGLKHLAKDRAEFVQRLKNAVKVICAPLRCGS
ncbi:MAG: TetR/AcrR family transcriptional regulator [Polyangiaceae bacterium]